MEQGSFEDLKHAFLRKLHDRDLIVGVIGLGYVGLPLADAFVRKGFRVVGFDIDSSKIAALESGRSYIRHIGDARVKTMRENGRFFATTNYAGLQTVDAILICVPTPLNQHREPDLSYVRDTAADIARYLRPGQLVVLESTTYPGTTDGVLRELLEGSGLRAGEHFALAYSPEREDPGNPKFETSTIPKVVGATSAAGAEMAKELYQQIVPEVVMVRDTRTAEATKLTENIFRAVNIALANELKIVFTEMDIDVWDVIDAAATKPFGFMPFYPGPGLGGHCIPIDPFYLTWKAREYGLHTRFIELAGEINSHMPSRVVDVAAQAMNDHLGMAVKDARILVVGMAYKPNVDDTRESPALDLIERLRKRGAQVSYYDPHVPVVPITREHRSLAGMKSIDWLPETLSQFDAALIATNHDGIDYGMIAEHVKLVIDTRNAMKGIDMGGARIVKA